LYCGLIKKIKVTRTRICQGCKGLGSKRKGKFESCGTCNGSGSKLGYVNVGFFVQQMKQTCDSCKGDGKMIKDKYKCKDCKGNKIVDESKKIRNFYW